MDTHPESSADGTPDAGRTHTQNISGSPQIGVAVSGDVHGGVHYHQSVTPITPYQLRAAVSDFVGRAKEANALEQALRAAAHTGGAAAISGVRGMGGIGKTELAYVVANRLRDQFADGQLVLNLLGSQGAAAQTSVQALQTVLRAFRPDAQLPDDEAPLVGLYRSLLSDKRVLILADDARDAAQVRPLLPPVGSALLVTSRFRFEIEGMTAIDLEELSKAEARQMVQTINAAIADDLADEIAGLCGYLPLALRAVAGLTKKTSRTVAEYVVLLRNERDRLSRMVDKRANVNVEASLALSYAFLEPEEQPVLAQLGVFSGACDRRSVEAIVASDASDLVDILDILCEANLLEYDADQQRYSLHELVRVFALARLGEAEEAARLRHARHYIAVAERIQQLFLAGGEIITIGLALFDRERTQFDAARAWLQTHAATPETDDLLIADADATAQIGDLRYAKVQSATVQTYDARIPQLEAALAAAQRRNNRAAQGNLLGNLGLAYADLGEVRRAIVYHEQALIVSREIGNRRAEGKDLSNLGVAYANLGEVRRAIGFYEQGLEIAREIGDRRGEGAALGNLGVAYYALGEVRRAIGFYEQYLEIAREIGDRRGEGTALGNLGVVYKNLGEVRRAIGFYEQQLEIVREIGDRQGEANASWNSGLALMAESEVAQALPLLERSLAFYQGIGHPQAAGWAATIEHVRQHGSLPQE